MALRFCPRINRRRAMLGMLAGMGAPLLATAGLPADAAALPADAAVPPPDHAPNAGKVYAAFFLGQGGYLFSWGIPLLAAEARRLGFASDVFSYGDVERAWTSIVRRRKEGYRIALVGYSLGNTTATYLQQHLAADLVLAIAESSLGLNHPIRKETTRRAVLWYGPDTLSSAGVRDGFDAVNYVDTTHLLMDIHPIVVRGVLDELKSLVAPERRDKSVVVANARAAATFPRANDKIAAASAPEPPSTAFLPPINVITPDVTCTQCRGFTQSLGGPDLWME
jgi:hypothetical protein